MFNDDACDLNARRTGSLHANVHQVTTGIGSNHVIRVVEALVRLKAKCVLSFLMPSDGPLFLNESNVKNRTLSNVST